MIVCHDQASWQEGYQRFQPSRPIKVPDDLARASGCIEGRAAGETHDLSSRVKRPRLRFLRKS
jgi:hypothetical protein